MLGKTILITGSNSGIGLYSAFELAGKGARILMHSRDKSRGEKAREEVISRSGNNDIDLFIADFADLEQVKSMAEKISLKYPQIDVLLNNAGLMTRKRQETVQGYEYQFGVNHLAHFLLTNLLIDKIMKSPSGRIINVTSAAHKYGRMHFDDINLRKGFSSFKGYAQSKLANVLFTYELCHRVYTEGITSNCVHPGTIATRFAHPRDPGKESRLMKILSLLLPGPEEGAKTPVYLASSPEVEDVSGQYFYKSKAIASSKASYDLDCAQKLWDLSLEMAGLDKSLI